MKKGNGLNAKFDLFRQTCEDKPDIKQPHVLAFFFFFNWDLLSGLGRTLATTNLVVAVPF